MILRWGRKGLIAGALAVAFVTPVPPASTTSIHEVQHRPSIKFEFRHVTPSSAGPTGIHRYQVFPDYKFKVRHVTPGDAIGDIPGSGSGRHRGTSPHHRAMRDDQEIIEMLASWINGKPN